MRRPLVAKDVHRRVFAPDKKENGATRASVAWRACRANPVIWGRRVETGPLDHLAILAIPDSLVLKDIEARWVNLVSEERLVSPACPVCMDDKAPLVSPDATERMDDQDILVNKDYPEDPARMDSPDFPAPSEIPAMVALIRLELKAIEVLLDVPVDPVHLVFLADLA